MQKLTKLCDGGHNYAINKDSVGVSRALQDAQRMLESQSQGSLLANPGLAKKLAVAVPKKKVAVGNRVDQLSVKSTANMPVPMQIKQVKITSTRHQHKPSSAVLQTSRFKKPSSVVTKVLQRKSSVPKINADI